MVSISNVLFGLVFVVIGLGVAGFGVQTGYMQVQDVNSAVQTTEGDIQSSTVTEDREREQNDDGETEIEIEYYPRVQYTYTVDGETYTGERIYSQVDRNQEPGELEGKEFDNPGRAENVAARFDPGDSVVVYYYPGNPGRSFLVKPSVDWVKVGGMVLFGLVFALAGVGAMFSDD